MTWYTNFAQGALSWVIIAISIVVFGGFGTALTFFILKQLRFNRPCIVYEYRGKDVPPLLKFDKGGIFVDKKSNMKRFFLKKHKVGLDANNVPWTQGVNGKQYVHLLQNGLKNFRFVNVNATNPDFSWTVGEEDVNWAITDYERQKKLFSQSIWIQLLPYMALAFVSIIILITFIYFFKEFDTLTQMAVAMREAAIALKEASLGTNVI